MADLLNLNKRVELNVVENEKGEAKIAYRDLREFLDLLENKRLLARVKAEVDPEWEIDGVTKVLQVEVGPPVLFENVKGHKVSVLSELLGTLERLGLALGMENATEREIKEQVVSRIEHPILSYPSLFPQLNPDLYTQ